MTLKRLLTVLVVLMLLAGIGIACLWQYAYTPQGRARNILAYWRSNPETLRLWLLRHGIITPENEHYDKTGCCVHDWGPDPLAKIGPEALPVVFEALEDKKAYCRMIAADACGRIGDPRAIGPLAKHLYDGDFHVASACIKALGKLGPDAAAPLLEASKNPKFLLPEEIPPALAQCLGTRAVPALIDMLKSKDPAVPESAAFELGNLKDKRATDALVSGLTGNKPGLAAAANALAEIGDPKAIPPLLERLHDKDINTSEVNLLAHCAAAGALVKMGRREGWDFLMGRLKSHDSEDRGFSAQELGDLGDMRAVEPLLAVCEDKDGFARYSAAKALGELGDTRAIPAIRKLLGDPDEEVRQCSEEAFKKLAQKLAAKHYATSQPSMSAAPGR